MVLSGSIVFKSVAQTSGLMTVVTRSNGRREHLKSVAGFIYLTAETASSEKLLVVLGSPYTKG